MIKKAHKRLFKISHKVLILLPIPGHPLQAKYSGPYAIKNKSVMWTM